ncbi:GntR family transcriptional regulator [Jeotgalibacillus sp. S-D1]|uniref:GntR family transcriptional regulator n=1 Tax=Jeotgalibacillus sp. S-D1 TaxID=2552189 RepID=UPI00105A875F|nr:GntR family transcriptional regulator [Jeotgalibacillus sp. S-D1]TDL33017.1 GntR family transcriptional regulator [Jeotgalibacillus sp. S-D1]
MYIHIDLEAEEPIYTQLKNQIIAGVARKDLLLGESLPSVRSMASDLGINLHTVNKAYQQLKQEGFILIHRQRGVVINPEGIPQANDEYRKNLQKSLHPLIAEAVCRGVKEEEFNKMVKAIYEELNHIKEDHE